MSKRRPLPARNPRIKDTRIKARARRENRKALSNMDERLLLLLNRDGK